MATIRCRTLGALLFPEFELLDVFGPLEAFGNLFVRDKFRVLTIGTIAGPVASAERQVDAARGRPRRQARRHLGAARHIVLAMRRLARRGERALGATIVDPIVFQTLAIARRIREVQATL